MTPPAEVRRCRKPAELPPRVAWRGLTVGKFVLDVLPPTKMSPVASLFSRMVATSLPLPPVLRIHTMAERSAFTRNTSASSLPALELVAPLPGLVVSRLVLVVAPQTSTSPLAVVRRS
ncbi:MAG: hypothetical protein GFGODING_02499 [Flavobacteriales bacterium]|nr:hypothetical protein [Flavobacteriales bacterium]